MQKLNQSHNWLALQCPDVFPWALKEPMPTEEQLPQGGELATSTSATSAGSSPNPGLSPHSPQPSCSRSALTLAIIFEASDAHLQQRLFVTANDFSLSIFPLLGIFMALWSHSFSGASEKTSGQESWDSPSVLGADLMPGPSVNEKIQPYWHSCFISSLSFILHS